MPRTGRGGARQGAPGTAYSNRSDLQAAKPVPIQAAPGQVYGQRQAQQAAQRAMPVAPQQTAAPPQAGSPAPSGPPQGAPPAPPALGGMPNIAPGDIDFLGPTQRPNEPLTHGLPVGPGPGREALTGIGALATSTQAEQGTVGSFLSHLAAQPNATSSVRDLAQLVGSGQAV